jgi:hypothetical protein
MEESRKSPHQSGDLGWLGLEIWAPEGEAAVRRVDYGPGSILTRRGRTPVSSSNGDEKGNDMRSPGPTKEYRDLLNGTIEVEEYVEEVKKDVDRRLAEESRESQRERRAS